MGEAAAAPSGSATVRRLRFLTDWRILATLLVLQFAVIVVLTFWPNSPSRPLPRAGYSSRVWEPYFAGHPGPWGELEYVRINIEPPEAFLPSGDYRFEPTRWFFEGLDPGAVKSILDRSDLTPAQRATLVDSTAWLVESNGITLTPGADLILELSASARAGIYRVLARSPRNEFQHWPYSYRVNGFQDWFSQSGLSPATMQLVSRLVYQRGGALCFSDLPELGAKIEAGPERRRLLKALFRKSGLLMKLRVRPDTDTEKLVDYWGSGGRAKDFRPLLESLTHVEGSISIDVAHLLPPFARKRVNTYPAPPANPNQEGADCYWTAMNFFNDPPDDRYFDETYWNAELEANYAIIEQPGFGDLVFLLLPDGKPIHAAVYIADEVVFTKNGIQLRQPWLLMKMEDMLAAYPEDQQLRVVYFRLKSRSGGAPPPARTP